MGQLVHGSLITFNYTQSGGRQIPSAAPPECAPRVLPPANRGMSGPTMSLEPGTGTALTSIALLAVDAGSSRRGIDPPSDGPPVAPYGPAVAVALALTVGMAQSVLRSNDAVVARSTNARRPRCPPITRCCGLSA